MPIKNVIELDPKLKLYLPSGPKYVFLSRLASSLSNPKPRNALMRAGPVPSCPYGGLTATVLGKYKSPAGAGLSEVGGVKFPE